MILYRSYQILIETAFQALNLSSKFGKTLVPSFAERKSFSSLKTKEVWVHVASVGEARGIFSLVDKIVQDVGPAQVILTTTSLSGRAEFSRLFPEVECVLAPLDLARIVRDFLNAYKPQTLIVNETEIWPTMILESKIRGIDCVLVNGRISDKSFNSYRMLSGFFSFFIKKFSKIYVQSEIDYERFLAIGAGEDQLEVTGSTKYDFPVAKSSSGFSTWMQEQYGSDYRDQKFITVLGSVREEEEWEAIRCIKMLFSQKLLASKEALVIVAPRHPERFEEIAGIFEANGLKITKRIGDNIKMGSQSCIILNKLGELLDAYAVADICFVGGTFSTVGGHNILEPAYFSKPILVGKNTQNVREVAIALENAGAMCVVSDGLDLSKKIQDLAAMPDTLKKMGEESGRVYESLKGATSRVLDSLKLLKILIVFCVIALNSACSPTKGYLGPELPDTELAIVYYDECDSNIKKVRASAEGVEFDSSGVSLLPGIHNFDSFVEFPQRPYDCVPQTTFDQSGYDSCLSRRNQALSKPNSKSIPNCYVSDYQRTSYWCLQNFKQFVCSASAPLTKNSKYDLCAFQFQGFVKAKILTHDTTQLIKESDCNFTTEEVRRLEFSSSY